VLINKLTAIVISASLLTACYGQSLLGATQPAVNSSARPAMRPLASKGSETLYVLNSGGTNQTVTVYANMGKSLLQNIDLGPKADTADLTVDAAGQLFASNGTTLSVYGDRGSKLLRKITQPHPFTLLTADASGNLYTPCGPSTLCEYAANSTKIKRRLQYRASALATNESADLAIDQLNGPVDVFGPKGKRPVWRIDNGVDGSTSVAFDGSGNLYIADDATADAIVVYAPGASQPARTITNGITAPKAMALDSSSNLYVLNGNDSVTVYAPGAETPIRTIQGLDHPVALTLDASDKLYIANEGDGFADLGSIVIFKKGATKYETAITNAIANPTALGVSKE
jgi:hypothetical protein